MNAKNEKGHPVRYKAMIDPLAARGIAEKTISGCKIDLN